MYTIKFDTEFVGELTGIYGRSIDNFYGMLPELSAAMRSIDTARGFGIEDIAYLIYEETKKIEGICDELITLCRKTEQVCEIYQMADRRIKNRILEILSDDRTLFSADNLYRLSEGPLICDNAVVHEDWLIGLAAEDAFGTAENDIDVGV